jgi:hypothetical protein
MDGRPAVRLSAVQLFYFSLGVQLRVQSVRFDPLSTFIFSLFFFECIFMSWMDSIAQHHSIALSFVNNNTEFIKDSKTCLSFADLLTPTG